MNDSKQPSRLVRASVSNVLGISLAEVKFGKDGGLTVVGGDNGAGKSSLLDALRWALDGSKPKGKQLLRRGEKKGLVTLELAGEVVEVKRSVTEKGDYLKVTGPDGADIKAPASVLKDLIGTFGIDPTEFLKLDDKDRSARVQKVMGVDFSDLDAEHKRLYEERALANRMVRDAEGALKNLPPAKDVEPVSVSMLMERIQEAEAIEGQRIDRAFKLVNLREDNCALKKEIEETEKRLAEMRERREKIILEGKVLASLVAQDEDATAYELAEQKDSMSLRAKLKDAESINARAQEAEKRRETEEKVKQLRAEAEEKNRALEDIDTQRAQRIADAPLSIPGVDIRDGVVHYDGQPFSEASDGEQLRTAFEIAAAGAPDLKVMFLRHGALLDDKSRQSVAELAQERGYTVVMEVVGTSGIDVLVENGETK